MSSHAYFFMVVGRLDNAGLAEAPRLALRHPRPSPRSYSAASSALGCQASANCGKTGRDIPSGISSRSLGQPRPTLSA